MVSSRYKVGEDAEWRGGDTFFRIGQGSTSANVLVSPWQGSSPPISMAKLLVRLRLSRYRQLRQGNVLRSAKAAQLVTIYALLTGLPEAHIESSSTQACTGEI